MASPYLCMKRKCIKQTDQNKERQDTRKCKQLKYQRILKNKQHSNWKNKKNQTELKNKLKEKLYIDRKQYERNLYKKRKKVGVAGAEVTMFLLHTHKYLRTYVCMYYSSAIVFSLTLLKRKQILQ